MALTSSNPEKSEKKILAKIDSWPGEWSAIGRRLHELVLAASPALTPKPFYGAPGYAADGPVLVHFRLDGDVMSFGTTEKANIAPAADDPDRLVPSAWFVTGLDAATEARITAIVQRAVS